MAGLCQRPHRPGLEAAAFPLFQATTEDDEARLP